MSGVRVREGAAIEVVARDDDARIFLYTRHQDIGLNAPLPRELRFEMHLQAGDLDEAQSTGVRIATAIASIAAFTANASAEPPRFEFAYDSTPDVTRRAYRQIQQPAAPLELSSGRWLPEADFGAVVHAVSSSPHQERLRRALGHYEVPLRYWTTGALILCSDHLFMACEALTPVIEEHFRSPGEEAIDHAARLGIDTAAACCVTCRQFVTKPWKGVLDATVRSHYLFQGDAATYQAAKRASDGLEHGFSDFDAIRALVTPTAAATFGYVREAILTLLDLPDPVHARLAGILPVDVSPVVKIVEGHLEGDVRDPLTLGPERGHPSLDWHTEIVKLDPTPDESFDMDLRETFTVRTRDGVSFTGEGFRVLNGLNPVTDNESGTTS